MGTFKQNELLIKNSMEFPCSYIQGKLEKRIYINLNNHVNLQKMITEFTKRGFRRNHNHMYIILDQNHIPCENVTQDQL